MVLPSYTDSCPNYSVTIAQGKCTSLRRSLIGERRFWDHIIRDELDMNRHIDYIHYNPVKHGLVIDPFRWRYSTLDQYHKDGYYARDWGAKKQIRIGGEYGE